MRTRATQREAIFYRLYKNFKEAQRPSNLPMVYPYLPVFALMGEIWIEETGKWGYVSYECSARASEMIKTNPKLVQRTKMRGKSGASYYGYRLNPQPHVDMIMDSDLLMFYRKISRNRAPTTQEEITRESEQFFLTI